MQETEAQAPGTAILTQQGWVEAVLVQPLDFLHGELGLSEGS